VGILRRIDKSKKAPPKVGAFFICVFALYTPYTYAQEMSPNGLGVHLGITNGLDYKRLLSNGDAINAILSSQWDGVLFTLMYQDQYDISSEMGSEHVILAFYGGGVHYGKFSEDSPVHSGSSIGLDVDMGVDHYFRNSPFVIGIEFRLILDNELKNWELRLLGDLALNLRYVF